MHLTTDNVTKVFLDCLFHDDEPTEGYIKAEGIMRQVGFHPGRLESHKADITDMLLDLPGEFMATGGGGMSFLNACMDKHGEQWTGLHLKMEELFLLGMAVGVVICLMPRDMWTILPGSMPYYVVQDTGLCQTNVDLVNSTQHQTQSSGNENG